LPYALENPHQQIDRLESGHDDRHAVGSHQRLVGVVAHHRAHVPRRQKTLHAALGRGQQRFHCRLHADVGHDQAEVLQAQLGRLQHGQRRGRRRGLEADGKEDDLAIALAASQLDGVQRRIDRPHVAPCRARLQQAPSAARHA
jgi:hypothetical protein